MPTRVKSSTSRFSASCHSFRTTTLNRASHCHAPTGARSLRSQVEAAASVGGSALVADILQLQAYTDLLEATQSPVQQQNAPTTATTTRTLDAPQAPATDGTSQATQLDVQVSSAPPQVALQMADSPLQVQLDLRATATREDVLNQLDALVTTLDQRIGELDTNIAVTDGCSVAHNIRILGRRHRPTAP